MNPQNRRVPADEAAYRRNYLSNLALQISNNQLNWNANQIFQTTGVTPTAPADPRSITDQTASVEDKKVQLRQALATQVTSWADANRVVDALATEEQVTAMIDIFPQMVEQLKKQYATGAPADVILRWFDHTAAERDQTNLTGYDLNQRIARDTLAATRENVAATQDVVR